MDHILGDAVDFAPIEDDTVEPGVYDKVVWADGSLPDWVVPAGEEAWIRALKARFPDEHQAIDKYLAIMRGVASGPNSVAVWN